MPIGIGLVVLGGCAPDAGNVPNQQAEAQKAPAKETAPHQTEAPQAPTKAAAPAQTAAPAPTKTAPPEQSGVPQTPAQATAPEPESIQPAASPKPAVEHVVIVIEENHSYKQIVGNKEAPYFNQLMDEGALLTNSYGVAHPSQPNYLALFSGSTQGMKDDSCGKTFTAPNLASELLDKKLTFTGYSEDLPKAGFTGCSSKGYARKHNPWVQFTNVPAELNQPLAAFPKNDSQLPTVSFVIPNHQDDMHDGTVQQADSWLKEHLGAYAEWAKTHNSLLIVTWDEDDFSPTNHIPTILVGPMVKQGKFDEKINHYNVLRTLEDLYQLQPIGESARHEPIKTIWK